MKACPRMGYLQSALWGAGVAALSLVAWAVAALSAARPPSAFPAHGACHVGRLWMRWGTPMAQLPQDDEVARAADPFRDPDEAYVRFWSDALAGGRRTEYYYGSALSIGALPWALWAGDVAVAREPIRTTGSGWWTQLLLIPRSHQERYVAKPGAPLRLPDAVGPQYTIPPLLAGDLRTAQAMEARVTRPGDGRQPLRYVPVRRYGMAYQAAADVVLLTLAHQTLRVWRQNLASTEPVGYSGWQHLEKLKWPCNELFRLLPSKGCWWFLTAGGDLWTVTRAGKPDREVRKAQHVGGPILGTISDQDLARSFIFGDGWYLDLGDEAKLVKEPRAKWPRPAKDAPDIERLRVYRSWVGRP